MRIEFTVVDDNGRQYFGAADLGGVAAEPARAERLKETRPKPDARPAKGLPNHILHLRENGFFREPRTPAEVHEKLQDTYNCLLDRVQMALLRLQRRRELRKAVKRTDEQEKTAYVW
jgi:hypothetical protein